MANGRAYSVKVEEVHSGDDLVGLVNLGIDGLFKRVRLRLHGVDTPNAYKVGAGTVAGSVRDEVRQLTTGVCRLSVVSEGRGGWVVTLYAMQPDGTEININSHLRSAGYVYTAPCGDRQVDTL